MTFPIYGKLKNVPNHQPDIYIYTYIQQIRFQNPSKRGTFANPAMVLVSSGIGIETLIVSLKETYINNFIYDSFMISLCRIQWKIFRYVLLCFFMVEFMIFDGEIYVFLMIFNAEKNKK